MGVYTCTKSQAVWLIEFSSPICITVITHWIALVQWFTILLKCIQELDIVFSFICEISYLEIQLLPSLQSAYIHDC